MKRFHRFDQGSDIAAWRDCDNVLRYKIRLMQRLVQSGSFLHESTMFGVGLQPIAAAERSPMTSTASAV